MNLTHSIGKLDLQHTQVGDEHALIMALLCRSRQEVRRCASAGSWAWTSLQALSGFWEMCSLGATILSLTMATSVLDSPQLWILRRSKKGERAQRWSLYIWSHGRAKGVVVERSVWMCCAQCPCRSDIEMMIGSC